MIEIKKNTQVSNIQFYTVYWNLIDEGVNFKTLATYPFVILNQVTGNKIVIPFNVVCNYYSTGDSNGYYIYQNSQITGYPYVQYILRFLQNGVQSDQSGRFVSATNLQAETFPNNIGLNNKINLGTEIDETNASYNTFEIWFSYYILTL